MAIRFRHSVLLLSLIFGLAARADERSDCRDAFAPPEQRIAACTTVIETGGDSAEDLAAALINRGDAYRKSRNYDRAIADHDEAIRLNPDYAEAYFNRGVVYERIREGGRAIADYTTAIELKPDYPEAYVSRGDVYRKMGDNSRAVADYTMAIELKRDYPEAYVSRARVYRKMGDIDGAIADYTTAIELKPDHSKAYLSRGRLYEEMGDYDHVIADFTKIIEITPDDANAYLRRANLYHDFGEYDRAIADYSKAIDLKHPTYTVVYIDRGDAYRDKGDYDRAIADYSKTIELRPEHTPAYDHLGVARRRQGDYDRAIADHSKAIALNPESAISYLNRGVARLAKQDPDRAMSDFRAAMFLSNDDAARAEARNLLAAIEPERLGPSDPSFVLEFETELAIVTLPAGYEIGDSSGTFATMVPGGETVNSWTQLFTISIRDHQPLSIAFMVDGVLKEHTRTALEREQESFFRNCVTPDTFSTDLVTESENGFPVAKLLQSCSLTTPGPSKARPETQIIRLVQGNEKDVFVSIALRYLPTTGEIERWRDFLGKTTLRPK